ncbi:NAD-binding Rossmann fold oxidoreductase family protein [Aureobasidium subglaciale]|nr:NAD-binding Rossmann fold oxidoreductase family protein [Aureobasidium subglaciale]
MNTQMSLEVPTKLRVGVVGLGRMGKRHAMNILHKVHRAQLICACSPMEADLTWASEILMPYGVSVVPTFEEMVTTPGLNAVIIASATPFHASQTRACLDLGIHVLCEKPVTKDMLEVSHGAKRDAREMLTTRKLEELVAHAQQSPKAKMMVAFVRRFDANYQDAKARIQQNAIGRPVVIRSQGCEPLDTSPFYQQYLRDSGGIFIDTIIHDIDLSLFFFGDDAIPKSVCAMGVSAHHHQLEAAGDADNAVGICEYWDGRIAYFYNSRTTPHGYDNATEIFGSDGKLSINLVPRASAIELCDKDGYVKTPAHPGWYERYAEAFVTEVTAWVDALLDDKPMPHPLTSTLNSLKIATALQQSLSTGRKTFFNKDGVLQSQ